jgi:hypothetical protein
MTSLAFQSSFVLKVHTLAECPCIATFKYELQYFLFKLMEPSISIIIFLLHIMDRDMFKI